MCLFLLLGFYVLGGELSVEGVERMLAGFTNGASSRHTWSDSEEDGDLLDVLLAPKKLCSLEEQFGVPVGDAVHHVAQGVQASFMHTMLQEPFVLSSLRGSVFLAQEDKIGDRSVPDHEFAQMVKSLDFANLHNNDWFNLDTLAEEAMFLILSRFNQEDDAAVCAVKKVASAVKGEPLKVSERVIALSALYWEILNASDPDSNSEVVFEVNIALEPARSALSKALQSMAMDENTLRYAITKLWVEGLKAYSQ